MSSLQYIYWRIMININKTPRTNLLYYYCCVYLGFVSSSSAFPRKQVVLSKLKSLGLALQLLQFQEMLLFVKALCYSLHLISSASFSIFLMSFIELQLQLEQPRPMTSSRSFSISRLINCNCIPFHVLST